MRLKIVTQVEQSIEEVFEGFDKRLFLKLSPPFPKVKLQRFDGCQTNDRVIIELNFIFFKQIWESHITESKTTTEEIYFIDKGVKLPFFLKFWEHKHIIQRKEGKTFIIDDIHYKAIGGFLGTLLFYPSLYLQFLYRKPIYKKTFKLNKKELLYLANTKVE